MSARNVFSILLVADLALAHSAAGQTSPAAPSTNVTEESRHLADAGNWDEAKAVLEAELIKKIPFEVAQLKAELAHLAADRNTYFHKDEASVLIALDEARSAVQMSDDQPALATLEMAEGRFTYWKALEKTKEWGPPTEHFDRALQIYQQLGNEIGLAEAMFYRGLVYQMQEQNRGARQIFEQALALTKKTGNERMQSFVERHIGYLQQTAGEIDAARASFQVSLRLRQRNEMKAFVPFALIALAEFEAEQKNPTEAIKLTEQALPLAKSGHSPRALYTAELELAKWYADQGKTTEANNLADQSRLGAEAFGDPSGVKEAEDFLKKHT